MILYHLWKGTEKINTNKERSQLTFVWSNSLILVFCCLKLAVNNDCLETVGEWGGKRRALLPKRNDPYTPVSVCTEYNEQPPKMLSLDGKGPPSC